MSYIQLMMKCKHCGYEFNVALGNFGSGMPEFCPQCGCSEFYKVSDGWNAKKELLNQ